MKKGFSKQLMVMLLAFMICGISASALSMPSVSAATKKVTLIKGVKVPLPSGYTLFSNANGSSLMVSNATTSKDTAVIACIASQNTSYQYINITNAASKKLVKNSVKQNLSSNGVTVKKVAVKTIKTKAGKGLYLTGTAVKNGINMKMEGLYVIKKSKMLSVACIYTSGLKKNAKKAIKTIKNNMVMK